MASAIAVDVPGAPVRTGPHRLASSLTLCVASAVGLVAFLYPFLLANAPDGGANAAHSGDAPLIFGALISLSAILFLIELSSGAMNAKLASTLAVLAVAAAVLRVPRLPAGATAFFLLIMLAGYVFGPRFGFLLGALALFVSSFVSGGFGPWVPFQMFASGWLGLTSGWLGALRPRLARHRRAEIVLLLCFGALWGFAFGALMNLWFWPYVATGDATSWRPGLGFVATVRHYWAFYLLTSAGWDAWGAIANVALLAVAGRPILSVLTRFRARFQVDWSP